MIFANNFNVCVSWTFKRSDGQNKGKLKKEPNGDFNFKVGKEDMCKATIAKHSLQYTINDNDLKLISFIASTSPVFEVPVCQTHFQT